MHLTNAWQIQLSERQEIAFAQRSTHIGSIRDSELRHKEFQQGLASDFCADPVIKPIVNTIRECLLSRPYFVQVKGLKKSDLSAFIALCASTGEILEPYHQDWAEVIREIRPSSDRAVGVWGVLNEHLHTDGTDWIEPNDITALFCVKSDQRREGLSRVLDVDSLQEQLLALHGISFIETLHTTPVPWKIADILGGETIMRPILSGDTELRWMNFTIEQGMQHSYHGDITSIRDMLDVFEKSLVSVERLEYRFMLDTGDVVLINNKKCLHARTPISSPSHSERVIKRCKIAWRKV